MTSIDIDAPGTVQLMLGNEAIARGALEAGIGFAASYPGTPASEILGNLAEVSNRRHFHAQWSTNEKVALEAAAGASFAGIPAIASMKQNGVNVASDFIVNLVMSGTGEGGLVLVLGDDPSGISSSNEEDTRWICKWMDIPLLEPSTHQEAKDMVIYAFELSREMQNLCIIRETTRLAHTRGNVQIGKLSDNKGKKAIFPEYWDVFNQKLSSYVTTGALAMQQHQRLHDKLKNTRNKFEKSPFNNYMGPDNPELLIIASGVCTFYSKEAVQKLNMEDKVAILKLGTTWPLPESYLIDVIKKTNKILFVEEIDPFIEGNVKDIAASLNLCDISFYGERTGHIGASGDLNTDLVIEALCQIMNSTYQARDSKYEEAAQAAAKRLPVRAVNFCPGCPHRATYWAVKEAIALDNRNAVVCGDIGCYALGSRYGGFFQLRTEQAMGSGIGIANGLGKLDDFEMQQPVIAIAGDSTFFHACIPALINAVYNQANIIFVILDNSATAMTGFQPHPGVGRNAEGLEGTVVDIVSLCKSIGPDVKVCEPFDLQETRDTIVDLLDSPKGPKVVVMRHPCELVRARREKKAPYNVFVDQDLCMGDECGCNRLCTRVFTCPALFWDKQMNKAKIDEAVCAGCGLCVDICPQGAIKKEEVTV